jgi:hypothetical protein
MGDIYGENMSQDDGGDSDIPDHLGLHDTYVDSVILCPKKIPTETPLRCQSQHAKGSRQAQNVAQKITVQKRPSGIF